MNVKQFPIWWNCSQDVYWCSAISCEFEILIEAAAASGVDKNVWISFVLHFIPFTLFCSGTQTERKKMQNLSKTNI